MCVNDRKCVEFSYLSFLIIGTLLMLMLMLIMMKFSYKTKET